MSRGERRRAARTAGLASHRLNCPISKAVVFLSHHSPVSTLFATNVKKRKFVEIPCVSPSPPVGTGASGTAPGFLTFGLNRNVRQKGYSRTVRGNKNGSAKEVVLLVKKASVDRGPVPRIHIMWSCSLFQQDNCKPFTSYEAHNGSQLPQIALASLGLRLARWNICQPGMPAGDASKPGYLGLTYLKGQPTQGAFGGSFYSQRVEPSYSRSDT